MAAGVQTPLGRRHYCLLLLLPHCLASHVGLKPALAAFEGQPTSALTTSLTYPVSHARPLHNKELPLDQHMEQQLGTQ